MPLRLTAALLLAASCAHAQEAAVPAPPAAAEASQSRPPLDIEAIKRAVREDPELHGDAPAGGAPASFRTRQLAEFERKVKQAQRPDCGRAFAGLGLLAIFPLAFSTVTDTGCKW